MKHSDSIRCTWDTYRLKLNSLTPEQVQRIDEYLASVGDYGEVHLVVQNGELRYINRIESHKTWVSGDDRRE